MLLFLFFLSFIFLGINLVILYSDIKYQKIPNKFLLYLIVLLPIYYIYIIYSWYGFNLISLGFFILSLIISFILYYFWIWAAWDAKYLLILTLFIPNIWIIPFIWNIALITLFYLLLYFFYFYWKIIINKTYRKSLFQNIFIDQKDKIIFFLKDKTTWKILKKDSIFKVLKSILFFLLFFVLIRLIRTDIIDEIKKIEFIKNNLSQFGSYFIFLIWILTIFIIYSYKKLISKTKNFFIKITKNKIKLQISEEKFKIINILLIIIILICIIIFDYIRNWNEVFHKLFLIFTIYLIMYIIFQIFFYAYKITFQIWEQESLDINLLNEWYIVDKEFLIKMFWTQACLWYIQEWEKKSNIKWLLYPNPTEFLQNISNPIDKETCLLIKKIYKTVNNYHTKNKSPFFEKLKWIKILKTFSFGPYIFIWFIITYFYWDLLWKNLILIATKIIHKIIF